MILQKTLLIISVFYSTGLYSQEKTMLLDWTQYFKMINRSDSLYSKGNFYEAARGYSNAFKFNNHGYSRGHKYKAACAWAKSGQTDSAIANLKQEIEAGFSEVKKLKSEKALVSIHKSEQWKAIVNEVKENEINEIKKLGKYKKLKSQLDKIFVLDQMFRNHYQTTIDSFGMGSTEMKELRKKMTKADKNNLKYVSQLIDRYGWISTDTIGIEGGNTLFMVIQHADSLSQEKYLPILKQAVKDKKALGEQLAMLEDRVLLRRGNKQIYGSQVHWEENTKKWVLSPVEDERNVDKRRAKIGLQRLKDYLKNFDIDYRAAD